VALSMYLASGQDGFAITSHPGSRTTSWFTFGDQVTASNLTGASSNSTAHWYFVSAVETWADPATRAMVVVGDSLTDGRGSTTNGNDRWVDQLFNRMQTDGMKNVGVVNQAAGGNRILADGLGPSALSRIERDVLAQSGVGYAFIWEGVNDIGTAGTDVANQTMVYDALIQAYQQMISRIHAQGIPVFGATITPFSGANSTLQPYSDPERERTRQKVNAWIKGSGWFDEVVDFDAVVRNPDAVDELRPEFDFGDYLHMNPMGYKALAQSVPLGIFDKWASGVVGFV
jgi:lysophospholipase L1-like esterase